MGRRLALLLVAVVIAALGTTLVFLYVKSADDRALENQRPVKVLFAKNEIPAGTSLRRAQTQGDLQERTIAGSTAIEGAMSTIEPIAEQVALTTIVPNQQLSFSMFGETVATSSSLPLPEGMIAVSFQFSDPARVAGFVQPGSEVVVFASVQDIQNQDIRATRVLLPKALVVGVGPTTAAPQVDGEEAANVEQLPRALLTLALTDDDAARLVFVSTEEQGALYLGLLNENSKVSSRTAVTPQNLFE